MGTGHGDWNSLLRDSITDFGSLLANKVWEHKITSTSRLKRPVYVCVRARVVFDHLITLWEKIVLTQAYRL